MFHASAALLVQHLLFGFLLVVAPVWDFYSTRRLKRNPGSKQKIGYYKTLCTWLWIASALAVVVAGFRPLFFIRPSPREISWLLLHPWVRSLAGGLIAVMAILGVVLPVGIVLWKKLTKQPRKYASADALKSLSYFLPATRRERRWWVFICVTAGVCEEILFRGFLLQYLHVSPGTLDLTLALLVSSAIFGVNHLYQGAGGVAGSAVTGFLLGLLFLLSGNLLYPVLLHAVLDLRMLAILRPPADNGS